jgi:hypothetical protein
MNNKKQQPMPSVLNPKWQYVPASSTDVLARFRSLGWVPPTEKKRAPTN